MDGNWGRVLEIDLATSDVTVRRIDETVQRLYVGGSALATRLLYDDVDAGTPPLSSGNVLYFTTGPLQSSTFPGCAKWFAVSKSPLTGTFYATGAGGRFDPLLKRTGYDAPAITGKAARPSYLLVTDTSVEIADAGSLWGKDAVEACEALADKHASLRPA